MKSNDTRCPRCHHSFGSKTHALRCKGTTGRQWRAARPRKSHTRSLSTRGHSAADVLAHGWTRNPETAPITGDYYTTQEATQP